MLAGGTDLLVAMKRKRVRLECLVNIKGIRGLNSISQSKGFLRIGALTPLREVVRSKLVNEKFPILVRAARVTGPFSIKNLATIGGNVCNASPAADTAPALLVLDAKAKIASAEGQRTVELEKFFVGPGKTALKLGELLVELQIPDLPPRAGGVYIKLPARTAEDLSTTGVAALIVLDGKTGVCKEARIALGAVAPTPIRAHAAEAILKGKALGDKVVEEAAKAAFDEVKPISDLRNSAWYRKEVVRALTRRAIKQALAIAKEAS